MLTIDLIRAEWALRTTGAARRRLRRRWQGRIDVPLDRLTDHRRPDRSTIDRALLVLLADGDEDAGWALLATYPWIDPQLVGRTGSRGGRAAAQLTGWLDSGALGQGEVLDVAWQVLTSRARTWPDRVGVDDYRWRYFGHFLARDVRRDLLRRGSALIAPTAHREDHAASGIDPAATGWAGDPEATALVGEGIAEIRRRLHPDQFTALAERSVGCTRPIDDAVSLACWNARIHRGRKAFARSLAPG